MIELSFNFGNVFADLNYLLFKDKKMNELKNINLNKITVKAFNPDMIKSIREKNNISQSVMAKLLNTSVSSVQHWEIGHRTPSGSALKLLNIIERHGITPLL